MGLIRVASVLLLALELTCCAARPAKSVNIRDRTVRQGIAYIKYPVVVGPKAGTLNPVIQGWIGSNCESLGHSAYTPERYHGVKDCLAALASYCAGPAGADNASGSTCEDNITSAAGMNSDGFLVIELDHFSHANMEPHGNYVTEFLNLDLSTGRTLHLSEILTNRYEATLDQMLVRALRKQWNVPADETLTRSGMDTIDPGIPYEFAIRPGGLLFWYQVGDVGPDAFGTMEVVLPYAELSGIINRKGPLGRLLKIQSGPITTPRP